MPELSIGFARFPVLAGDRDQAMGERRVHLHPRRQPAGRSGRRRARNYWAACGVHGRVLAGRGHRARRSRTGSSTAIRATTSFGMDVARFGAVRGRRHVPARDTTAQFYARRFVMAYPERGAAGGPAAEDDAVLRGLPRGGRAVHRELGARGAAVLRARAPTSRSTTRSSRSNAEPIVAEEVAAVRTAAGAYEIAQYARYEVSGPDAEAWLDHLLAGTIPVGRADPARADAERGRAADGRPHGRAARRRSLLADGLLLPAGLAPAVVPPAPAAEPASTVRNITDDRMGFSISGPASRGSSSDARARGRRRTTRSRSSASARWRSGARRPWSDGSR